MTHKCPSKLPLSAPLVPLLISQPLQPPLCYPSLLPLPCYPFPATPYLPLLPIYHPLLRIGYNPLFVKSLQPPPRHLSHHEPQTARGTSGLLKTQWPQSRGHIKFVCCPQHTHGDPSGNYCNCPTDHEMSQDF